MVSQPKKPANLTDIAAKVASLSRNVGGLDRSMQTLANRIKQSQYEDEPMVHRDVVVQGPKPNTTVDRLAAILTAIDQKLIGIEHDFATVRAFIVDLDRKGVPRDEMKAYLKDPEN